MNDYQIAKQASYKLILREAGNYPEDIKLIPRFELGIVRLKEISEEIDDLQVQQQKNITGVTSGKNVVMNELMELLIDISGAMHSYATHNNDKALQAKVDFKESQISKMGQSDLLATATIVYNEAIELTPEELAHEGITAREMDEFKAIHNQFKEVSPDTREAIIDRSSHTRKIAELFSEASKLKKSTLDRLASQFKRKSPDFYLKYKAATIVIYRKNTRKDDSESSTNDDQDS